MLLIYLLPLGVFLEAGSYDLGALLLPGMWPVDSRLSVDMPLLLVWSNRGHGRVLSLLPEVVVVPFYNSPNKFLIRPECLGLARPRILGPLVRLIWILFCRYVKGFG